MKTRQILIAFVLTNLLAVGGLFAQPIEATATANGCRVVVADDRPAGWTSGGVQFSYRLESAATASNFGAKDSAAPYTRERTFTPGVYVIGAVWTATGKPAIVRDLTRLHADCRVEAIPPPPPPPPPVACVGAWGVSEPYGEWSPWTPNGNGTESQLRQTRQTYHISQEAENFGEPCEAVEGQTRSGLPLVETRPVTPPPPVVAPFPGFVTDAVVLGACSQAQHDRFILPPHPITGKRYYTWHPHRDPSGCYYGHEHGPDPQPVITAALAWLDQNPFGFSAAKVAELKAAVSQPIYFGLVASQHPMPGEPDGHAEPHEGFKLFPALYNECNDEGRCSLMIAFHITHMGTGGVGRYQMPEHSVESRQFHMPSGAYQITNQMFDTGGANTVCDPRQSPTRDFIAILTSPCKINSPYEIWTMLREVKDAGGRLLARFIATPAVFDPVTVMNRSNPTEVVRAWDPRVALTRNFQTPSWADFKGCERESYAQPGTYEVAGHFSVWTTPTGQVVPAGTPKALPQWWYSPQQTSDLRGATPNAADKANGNIGNHAFKIRRECSATTRANLGLKN